MTVASGAVLNLTGGADKCFEAYALAGLINAGTVNWTGGRLFATNSGPISAEAQIDNQAGGVFNVACDANVGEVSVDAYFRLNNAGLFRKSGTAGTNVLSMCFFSNSGTAEVQSGTVSFGFGYTQGAGITKLTGGRLACGYPIYLNGGVLSGVGQVNGPIVNSAEVKPGASPGAITINGSYTQTATGRLTIEIGGPSPGSQHDRLVVSGPATLAGTLQLSLTNGFAPKEGDSFNVLSYGSRSGAFSTSNAGLLGLTESYTPTSLLLIAGSNATGC